MLAIITSGDPHGIGPELILKSFDKATFSSCLVIGSRKVFEYYYRFDYLSVSMINYINLPCLVDINKSFDVKDYIFHIRKSFKLGLLNILNVDYLNVLNLAIPDGYAGKLSLFYVKLAYQLIFYKFADVLFTCPINKQSILSFDKTFVGHTEYLAEVSNSLSSTMLMTSNKITIALATTHVRVRDISVSLSFEKIAIGIERLYYFLKNYYYIRFPRIAVCGLNPHAGEGGFCGKEEIDLIRPAIVSLKNRGFDVDGPFASDTLFARFSNDSYDAYFAMYHDQALIPFKLMSFGKGVNITLGLPFLRFSVDHGTAYDIVGKNMADNSSFVYALKFLFSIL